MDVRALIVRGDEDARRAVRRVVVEPLSIVPARARLTDLVARRAVRYEGASVFFLDDRSFAEPDGFWVGGSRQSTFVVQADRPQPSVDLHLRNAPVDNRLTLESGQWREELTLAAGRRAARAGSARARSAGGARHGDEQPQVSGRRNRPRTAATTASSGCGSRREPVPAHDPSMLRSPRPAEPACVR